MSADEIITTAMLLGGEFEQRAGPGGRGQASWRCQGSGLKTGFYFLQMDAAANYITRRGFTLDWNGGLHKID